MYGPEKMLEIKTQGEPLSSDKTNVEDIHITPAGMKVFIGDEGLE